MGEGKVSQAGKVAGHWIIPAPETVAALYLGR